MLRNSITVRSARFACLFPVLPELKRELALKFYTLITENGVELPTFTVSRNNILFAHQRGGTPASMLTVGVDHLSQKLRFLVVDDFPTRAFESSVESANLAWDAFSSVWPLERLGGQQILAEATIRLVTAVEENSGSKYLLDRVLKLRKSSLAKLSRETAGAGMRLMVPLQVSSDQSIPLDGAEANLHIETLMEDPTKLFFQLTVKWPSIALPPHAIAAGAPSRINVDLRKPGEYLTDTYNYLTGAAMDFLEDAAAK